MQPIVVEVGFWIGFKPRLCEVDPADTPAGRNEKSQNKPLQRTAKVVVDPETPFRFIAALLVHCRKKQVSCVTLGTSSEKIIDAFRPPGAWKLARRNRGAVGKEAAIAAALKWLARHQDSSGFWSCKGFGIRCRDGKCGGPGGSADYDVGVTGLALLAFLGAGHTQTRGDFQTVVRAGLKALQDLQGEDGCFGEKKAHGHWIYNHALCTFAVSEAYKEKSDVRLGKTVRKSVDFLLECQNPEAGWRYGIRPGRNDTCCTALAVEALASARRSGIEVPGKAFQGALNWIEEVTDVVCYKTGYTSEGDTGARLRESFGKFISCETNTAAAIVTRILSVGEEEASRLFEDENEGATKIVLANRPAWTKTTIDLYYWYWGSLAMYKIGGESWRRWKVPLENAIVSNQINEGCSSGSWDPIGAWGPAGGRVYATAINALSLEIPYGFLTAFRRK